MLVCQDPSHTKRIFNVKRMHVVLTVKEMTLFGRGKEAVYRCVCGHTETQAQMDQRLKNKNNGKVSKKI